MRGAAMRICFLDQQTFPAGFDLAVPAEFRAHFHAHDQTTQAQRLPHLAGVDIAITNKVRMDAELLAQLPELKAIFLTATGYDNVDLQACQQLGIAVNNVRGYSTASVADHCMMLLLNLKRQARSLMQLQQQQAWATADMFCLPVAAINDLAGQTLVILGAGDIGQALARRARAFDMEVIFAERPASPQVRPGYLAFEQALAKADVLSLHCPLNADTQGLINQQTLALLKPGALLINSARGGLVDEAAVVAALNSGQLGGLGLDVATQEPLVATNPLWQLNQDTNFILTPHIAWASEQSLARLMQGIWDNVRRFQAGQSQDFLVPAQEAHAKG